MPEATPPLQPRRTHGVVAHHQPAIVRMLAVLLEDDGHVVTACGRADDAYDVILETVPDFALIDVDLPDLDGFGLVLSLRASSYDGPVILLSGRRDIAETVRGFNAGADDYIGGPFEPLELMARVAAIMRRVRQETALGPDVMIVAGDAELSLMDLTYQSAVVGPVMLSPTEARMLETLMRSPGVAISRGTLHVRVWGYDLGDDLAGNTNRIDVNIRRLRRKIERDPAEPCYLQTITKVGYAFCPRDDVPMHHRGLDQQPALVAASY